MKSLTKLMESNKYNVTSPDNEYFIVLDHSSIDEGNYQQLEICPSLEDVRAELEQWMWNFEEFWCRKYSDPKGVLGYTVDEIRDWFRNKSNKQIDSFLSTIKNLKPWTSAQFIINFPKSYIIAATATRIGLTGMNAKKQ